MNRHRLRTVCLNIARLCLVAAVVWTPSAGLHLAAQRPEGFPDLIGGLKSTPGCLGVETARTGSGKQVIFAWFENKQGLLNWYASDTHRHAMRLLAPDGPARTPLAHLPDDGTPILVIASLTIAEGGPARPGLPPLTQISVELYKPAPGGLALGGRFAPAALTVPGLVDLPALR
jgi:hypothetical protein